MRTFYRSLAIAFSLLLAVACAAPAAAPAANEQSPEAETSSRLAAIFPGTITDADYNTLGHIGITAVQDELGAEIAYSESVAVPDVDRVMREYIDDGFNIIFTHGGQFLSQTRELAEEFPEVTFIAEADGEIADIPDNLWVIVRNMEIGAYGAGAVAAKLTESGKIGYITGLTLPFSYAEAHAIEQAITDLGLDVTVTAVWAGDFNDPGKARELAETLIGDGNDVLVSSLNLGTLGVFEAAKNANSKVLVIAKYTDKSEFAPDNYVTSALYDFTQPLTEIVQAIMDGTPGGNYHLGFDTGIGLQLPLQNASDEVNDEAVAMLAQMISGEIVVAKNTEPIE